MLFSKNIILIGPMGAGKSTVGRCLAQMLRVDFVDSDAEIEHRAGADIPWIFEIEGEAGFREREARILSELCQRDRIVIATGGGAVMREENRTLLVQAGFIVYLEASIKEQLRRTSKDNKRPLLSGKNRNEVLSELSKIRTPIYREIASLILPTTNKSAHQLAKTIMLEIEKRAT